MDRFVAVSDDLPLRDVELHEAQLLAERTEGVGFGTTGPASFSALCRGLAGDYRDVAVVAFFARDDADRSLPRRAEQAGFDLAPIAVSPGADAPSPADGTVTLTYFREGPDPASLSRAILALVQLALRTRSDPWHYLLRELRRGGPHTWAWQEWYSRTAGEAEAAATFAEEEFRTWASSETSAASGAGLIPDPPLSHAGLDVRDNIPGRPSAESPVDWKRADPEGWTERRTERLVENLETFRTDLRDPGSSWYLEPPDTDHRAAMEEWLERLGWRLRNAELTARDAGQLAQRAGDRARDVRPGDGDHDGESRGGGEDVAEALMDRLAPLARRVREAARSLAEWKAARWTRLGLAAVVGIGLGAASAAYLLEWNGLLLAAGGVAGGVVTTLTALAVHVSGVRARETRLTEAKEELAAEDRRLWKREAGEVLRARVSELREEDRRAWSAALREAAKRAEARARAVLAHLSEAESGGEDAEADPVRQRRQSVDRNGRETERLAREEGLLEDFTFWTEDLFENYAGEDTEFTPGSAVARRRVAARFRARSSDRAEAPDPSRVRADLSVGTMKDLVLGELETPGLSDPVGTVVLAPGGDRFALDSHMVRELEEHAVDDAVLAVSFFQR